MRRCLCVIAILAAVATAATARGPTVETRYEYYDVGGRTAADIRHALDKNGVRWTDDRVYDAVTRWYVRWTYQYERVDERCRISGVVTRVDVVIRLPRWTDRDRAPAALRSRWDRYISALHRHELGHRRFGIRAAAEIEAAIAAMDAAADCRTLGTAANAIGGRILDEYRREEIAYDRDTRHGYVQGAVFP
jgi:predicted secreted Zn-dependent protease